MDQPLQKFAAYEDLVEIGRGTTGIVYRARHSASQWVVALKMVTACGVDSALRVERFHRESLRMAYLTSKPETNIPTLYEVGECDGKVYYARAFVDGCTLEQWPSSHVADLKTGLRIMHRVAEVAQRLHSQGIAHRQLSPANVLVASGNSPMLIGFGLVGHLADFDPGIPGVPAEVDVCALQEMLGWLVGKLCESIPPRLRALTEPGSVASPQALADALASYLQETYPQRKPWWRFW